MRAHLQELGERGAALREAVRRERHRHAAEQCFGQGGAVVARPGEFDGPVGHRLGRRRIGDADVDGLAGQDPAPGRVVVGDLEPTREQRGRAFDDQGGPTGEGVPDDRERQRVVVLPEGDLHDPLQVLLAARVAGELLGFGELGEQRSADRLALVVEGELEPLHRGVGFEHAHRFAGGGAGIVRDLGSRVVALGTGPVGGEQRGRGVDVLERTRDAAVTGRASAGREVADERLAEQLVAEAVGARRARQQDVRLDRAVDEGLHRRRARVDDLRQQLDGEVVLQQRGLGEQLGRRAAELRGALPHDVTRTRR